jgi:hypothetical protein
MVGFVWWKVTRLSKAMARALQSPSPEALLAEIGKSRKPALVADADAFIAQSRAFALALYGEGDRARAVLESIDWRKRSPLVQAAGVASESLIALLCDVDLARGLTLARRARDLADIPALTPGAGASARVYSALVAFAQVLAEDEDISTLPALQRAARAKRYPTLHAIALAGLAVHAERAATPDREQLREQLASFAPHLNELVFGTEPVSAS